MGLRNLTETLGMTPLAYHSLCSSIFSFYPINFVKDFSGTTKVRILIFGINIGYDLYCVIRHNLLLLVISFNCSMFSFLSTFFVRFFQ